MGVHFFLPPCLANIAPHHGGHWTKRFYLFEQSSAHLIWFVWELENSVSVWYKLDFIVYLLIWTKGAPRFITSRLRGSGSKNAQSGRSNCWFFSCERKIYGKYKLKPYWDFLDYGPYSLNLVIFEKCFHYDILTPLPYAQSYPLRLNDTFLFPTLTSITITLCLVDSSALRKSLHYQKSFLSRERLMILLKLVLQKSNISNLTRGYQFKLDTFQKKNNQFLMWDFLVVQTTPYRGLRRFWIK